MKVAVKVPGTCGELVQGLIDGHNFLVSFPINKYSQVVVLPHCQSDIVVAPKWRTKVKEAAIKTLTYFNQNMGLVITVESDLPIGKGWASSSADVLATICAVAKITGNSITERDIAQIALSIEPTDSVFLPGLAMFDHVTGERFETLGPALPMNVLALEFSDTVDTLMFNCRPELQQLNRAKEKEIRASLELVKAGVREQNVKKVAQGATISSLAHQRVLYKPHLEAVLDLAMAHQAIGINIAHSGTTIGILFEGEVLPSETLLTKLKQQIPGIQEIHLLEAICGGISYEIASAWGKY
ncbi:MAG: hypothetical protein SCK28_14470 [Bacillota bacterium]|nr:hypothetical protein [Bacillota bacterium]